MKYSDDMSIIGIILGAAGVFFGLSQTARMRDAAKKLDMTVEEISRRTPLDIKESVINKAVQKSVDREAKYAIANAVKTIGNHVTQDMDKAIRNDVTRVYNDIRGKVEVKIAKEVGKISADEIKAGVRKKVEDKLFEQFCDRSGITDFFDISSSDGTPATNVDLEKLSEIIDSIPYNERAEVVKSILGK